MRIYLAGIYSTAKTAYGREDATENVKISAGIEYPFKLESYHYIHKGRPIEVIRECQDSIFLDSGAFSMFTQGIDVNLKAYADFIHENQRFIHVASNLDHIGAAAEDKSYANQKELESYGVEIAPVHHARDKDEWLQRYLDEGYDYIFLGGMVPETTNYLRTWLDHVWDRYLTNPDGTPKVKVHGFGLTTLELMFRYPWYSVDSTAWIMASRMGTVLVDLPHKDVKVSISDKSPKIKNNGQHFDTMPVPMQDAIRQRVEEMGYTVEQLRTMYGWRDRWNAGYYERIMARGVNTFKNLEMGLF